MRPIDADALKVHVCDMCDDGQRECKGDESCAILCWINDMLTIENEPARHGHWIPLKGWFNKSIVKCSVCGNTVDMDGVNAGRGDANFCPNCGARMDTIDYKC